MTDAALAVAAAVLLMAACSFQVLLAAGAPLGHVAYGGRAALPDRRLPGTHRAGSALAAVVLLAAAALVLAAGGVLPGPDLRPVLWLLAALCALNTLGNATARHPVERWGAGGATAALTVLLVLLAT